MTHQYQIEGMHCNSCVAKVEQAIGELNQVEHVEISLNEKTATVSMKSHVETSVIGQKVEALGYALSEVLDNQSHEPNVPRSWIATYFPLLLIFFFISVLSLLSQLNTAVFNLVEVGRYFMAGFFLVFSFFKFLNIKAFADAYSGYDIIAKRWKTYGLIYPFIELTLGILYFINYNPIITNAITFLVMGVSTIGVVQSLLDKKKIQCACLGAVFDLPMSKVTLIEDLLMVAMAGMMLVSLA